MKTMGSEHMTRTHKGIEIRAEINGQPVLHTDSYTLHLFGKLGQYADRPGLSNGYQFPPAPAGWGYLLGMPFAPCPNDPKSPVLSIMYRATETETAEPADDEEYEDDARDVRWIGEEIGTDAPSAMDLANWKMTASPASGHISMRHGPCGTEIYVQMLAYACRRAEQHRCNRG